MANEKTCIIDETRSQIRPTESKRDDRIVETRTNKAEGVKRGDRLASSGRKRPHKHKENLSFPISMKPENGPYRETDLDKLEMKLQSSDKLEMKLQSSDKLDMKLQSSQ